MNNNIEVIGIDHGWSQMKTSNTSVDVVCIILSVAKDLIESLA